MDTMNAKEVCDKLGIGHHSLARLRRRHAKTFPTGVQHRRGGPISFDCKEIDKWIAYMNSKRDGGLPSNTPVDPTRMRYYRAEVHSTATDEAGKPVPRVRRLTLRVEGGLDAALQMALSRARVTPDAVVGFALVAISVGEFMGAVGPGGGA